MVKHCLMKAKKTSSDVVASWRCWQTADRGWRSWSVCTFYSILTCNPQVMEKSWKSRNRTRGRSKKTRIYWALKTTSGCNLYPEGSPITERTDNHNCCVKIQNSEIQRRRSVRRPQPQLLINQKTEVVGSNLNV